jgi:hypothetical protein
VEEGTAVGAVTVAVGTVAPSVLDGGVAVASFNRASPEASLLGDLVPLPELVAVDVDSAGAGLADREASFLSELLEVVLLVVVGDAGLEERTAYPWSEVSRSEASTFSVWEPIMVSVFSMPSVNTVYYLPQEEIAKEEWKLSCPHGRGRGDKRDGTLDSV